MNSTYSVTKAIIKETICIAERLGFCSENDKICNSANIFNSDRVPIDVLISLLRSVSDQLSDPDIGIKIGHRLQINCCTLLGYLLMCSQTMRESLPYVEKFHCLVLDVGKFSVQRDKGDVIIAWDLDCKHLCQERLIIDLMMGAMRRFGIWVIGEKREVIEINLQYKKPKSLSYLNSIFPCRLRFNSDINSFRLPED